MAKRFTDTEIWKKQWFRLLSPKMKTVWWYLCTNCDHAGLWEIDLDTMTHFVGEPVSIQDIQTHLGTKISFVSGDKIFIQGFIEFQYKCSIDALNPKNKAHFSVINILEKYGLRQPLSKPLASPLQGAKEQEQDKDKDKDKERNSLNATQKFDLRFDPQYQKFEEAILSVSGFTPRFKYLLPDVYQSWKGDIPSLITFIEGRIAASKKIEGDKEAWLRKALIVESNLEVG